MFMHRQTGSRQGNTLLYILFLYDAKLERRIGAGGSRQWNTQLEVHARCLLAMINLSTFSLKSPQNSQDLQPNVKGIIPEIPYLQEF